jgi:SOS-response transcriptional repressor LexA
MSPLRLEVLDFVREELAATGCAPSYRAIQRRFGMGSPSNAHAAVSRLVEAGLLVRSPGRDRGLRLPGADLRAVPSESLRAELARREAA